MHNVDTSKISIESKSKEYFYRWSRNETVDDKNGTISLTIDKYDFNRTKIATFQHTISGFKRK